MPDIDKYQSEHICHRTLLHAMLEQKYKDNKNQQYSHPVPLYTKIPLLLQVLLLSSKPVKK